MKNEQKPCKAFASGEGEKRALNETLRDGT